MNAKQNVLRRMRRCSGFDLISNGLIVVFCLFSLFPLYWLFSGSLKYSSDVVKIPPDWIPRTVTFSNYRKVFENYPAWLWILNSMAVTLLTCGGIVLVASGAGYALSKMKFVGKNLIFAYVIAALLVPMEVYILPLYKEVVQMGIKGKYLSYILPNLAMPFGVYLLKNFYDSIPDEILEATQLDDCGKLKFFFYFGIPLSKPGVAALAILSAIRVWNNYLWQLLMADPDNKSFTLPVGVAKMFDATTGDMDYGLRFAASALTAIPLMIVFFCFQKFFTSGVSAGAVKG